MAIRQNLAFWLTPNRLRLSGKIRQAAKLAILSKTLYFNVVAVISLAYPAKSGNFLFVFVYRVCGPSPIFFSHPPSVNF